MSPEAQRIAIAETCGWEVVATNDNHFELHAPDGRKWKHFWTKNIAWATNCIPDYLSDLNAMHSAVRAQSVSFRVDFNNELRNKAISLECLICDLTAKDWADVFIGLLNSHGGK